VPGLGSRLGWARPWYLYNQRAQRAFLVRFQAGGPAQNSGSYAVFAWDNVGKGMQLLHGIKWDLKQKKQGVITHALFQVT